MHYLDYINDRYSKDNKLYSLKTKVSIILSTLLFVAVGGVLIYLKKKKELVQVNIYYIAVHICFIK